MSADLLADLDSFYQPTKGDDVVVNTQPSPLQSGSSAAVLFDADALQDDFDDDDFGQFESADTNTGAVQQSEPVSQIANVQNDLLLLDSANLAALSNTSTQAAKASLIDDFGDFQISDTNTENLVKTGDSRQSNISFEKPLRIESLQISTVEPERTLGFGDFLGPNVSTVTTAPLASKTTAGAESSNLIDFVNPPSVPSDKVRAFRSTNNPPQDYTEPQLEAEEEKWDDFESVQTKEPVSKIAKLPGFPQKEELGSNEPPPANVPPPSRLIGAFAPFLTIPDIGKLPNYNELDIETRAILERFALGYILLAQTLSRIIAGRTQRWKRDSILAASTRISSSQAKGMKLQSIDRSERMREDNEVAEVLEIWKKNSGRIRSIVTLLSSKGVGKAGLHPLPALNGPLRVKVVGIAEGGITAPKPCALCGLMRNERVDGVDVDVQDSFGEWWTEMWGHRACRNWWYTHEANLRQR